MEAVAAAVVVAAVAAAVAAAAEEEQTDPLILYNKRNASCGSTMGGVCQIIICEVKYMNERSKLSCNEQMIIKKQDNIS